MTPSWPVCAERLLSSCSVTPVITAPSPQPRTTNPFALVKIARFALPPPTPEGAASSNTTCIIYLAIELFQPLSKEGHRTRGQLTIIGPIYSSFIGQLALNPKHAPILKPA